jgi:hypothetical protein
VLAKQRRFRRLLLEELPKHFALAEFVSRVGGHAAATVATMAAIAPNGPFFSELGATEP